MLGGIDFVCMHSEMLQRSTVVLSTFLLYVTLLHT